MSVRCRALRAVAVVSILVAACGGRSGAALAPGPVTASPAVPAQRAAARVPRAAALGAAEVAVYRARTSAIPARMRRRMIGGSWHPRCPVVLVQLRPLQLRSLR